MWWKSWVDGWGHSMDGAMRIRLEDIGGSAATPTQDNGTGRLTTSQLLTTVQQLGTQLGILTSAYQGLPEAGPDQLPELLDTIMRSAKAIQGKADRLRDANR